MKPISMLPLSLEILPKYLRAFVNIVLNFHSSVLHIPANCDNLLIPRKVTG